MPGQTITKTWVHNPAIYAPAKFKRACRYHAFVPTKLADLSISLDGAAIGVVSEAEHAIRDLNAVNAANAAAGAALGSLGRLLLRTESIASSKVEGMQLGVRELARAEARVDEGGRASPTAMEVLANIDAMMLAVNDAAIVDHFAIEQIRAIHRRLLERERPTIAGVIRTEQNWIGGNDHNPCGADFVPPPPEEVDALLTDLSDAINSDLLPPLIQAALVHAQFESIHPFADGNGRAGRALIHVILRRRGVAPRFVPPISVVLAAAKSRYIAGLGDFRGSGVQAWIEYFADAMARSARLAAEYVAATQALAARWREQLAALPHPPRADAAAWALIDVLPAHPVITALTAADAVSRATGRIYEALDDLERARVLIPLAKAQPKSGGDTSRSRRKLSWEAAGLLDLIANLEAAQPLTHT